MLTSPSYVSFPPTILPWGTLTAPHAGKGKERCEENTNKGENSSRPLGNTGHLQLCLGQSYVGSSQLEQSLDQGRGAEGLRWTAGLEEKAEEGIGLVFRLPAFGGGMLVVDPDVVATCCCPCCCPCWGWSTAKGSSGQQTPGTKRDLKQMEPRNWTRSAKSRGQSWDMSQDICSPARM